MASFQQRRDAVVKLFGVWNQTESPAHLSELYAEKFTVVFPLSPKGSVSTLEEFRAVQQAWHTVLNPFRITFEALLDGPLANQIIGHWHVRGPMTADFGPIKAHGKKVRVDGVSIWTFNNEGRISHEHIIFDGDDTLSQFKGEKLGPQDY